MGAVKAIFTIRTTTSSQKQKHGDTTLFLI